LVVVLSVSVATCRIGELFTAPTGGELIAGGTLDRSAPVGSSALVLGKIPVDNTGKGVLTWEATILGTNAWISIQNPGGSSKTDSVRVMLNPAGLDTGTYEDSISITSDAGGAGTVHVNWHIVDCEIKPIQSAGEEKSDTLTGADCGARHQTGTHAQFYGFIGNQGDVATVLLSSGAFNGFVALDTSLKPTVAPLDTASQCLGDTKKPCIYYFQLPSNTMYYIEVSGATAADTGLFDIRLISGSGRNPNTVQSLQQFLIPDSSQTVAIGGSVGASALLHGVVSDSDAVDSLRLQAEWAPLGTPFQGVVMATGPYTKNGQIASVILTGLIDTMPYHWQVRAVDQRANFSSVGANWDSLPRGSNPDFIVQIGHNPGIPQNLIQLQSDGVQQIPVGGYANTTTVKFQGQVTDQDSGDVLHLEVEVEQKGIDTTGTKSPNQTFTTASSGGTSVATVIAPTIQDLTSYHWIARTVDQGGRHSPWVAFGSNPETQTDFRDSVQSNFNLVWTVQPTQTTAGVAIFPAPQITAKDALNQTITSFTGPVTMTISGPGPFAPSTTATVNAVAGVATFSNLVINKAGPGYTLVATSGTTNSVPSNSFTIIAAAVTQLVFTVPPSSATAGVAIAPAIQVSAEDPFNNVNPNFTGPVTMSIAANPGSGTLRGTPNPVSATAGVATFSTLNIDKIGNGYTLRASNPGLTPATSGTFAITAAPVTHLVFAVQPSTAAAGVTINPSVQVAGRDSLENTVPTFTGNVTVAILANPGGGTLSGTPTIPASSGVAIFSNLSIDKIGTGYTLTAASSPLQGATSLAFNITNAQISNTLSTVVPTPATITASNGSSQSTIAVTARDVSNNTVAGASVTLSVTGSGNTVLPAGPQTTNGAGVATWTLSSTAAEVKTVTAIINSVSISQQPTVTVNPGTASALFFTTPPTTTAAGAAINAPGWVGVTARDQFGNTATSFTNVVTMAVAGPGPFAPTSTNSAAASAGVANFPNLRIYQAGSGYTLTASSGALSSGASASFSITVGPAVRDTFSVQPGTTQVLVPIDSAIGGVKVRITDSVGNTVTTDNTHTITMALISGPNANFGGTKTKTVSTGVATFTDLTLDKMGTYTLSAVSNLPTNPSDISAPFDIIAGPAKTLVFKQQPTSTVAGAVINSGSGGVVVAALDAVGDTATGFTGSVTMALNPSSGNLGGTLTVAAASGIATFSNLTVAVAGNYTLTASATAVTSGTSASFPVQPGGVSAGTSTVSALPSSITASSGSSTSTITVTARDAGNNVIAGATVFLSISGTGNTTSPVSLTATTNGSGQAIWTLSSTVAESKTVSAVINSISINQTATVVVNPASPAVLVFTKQPPASVTAGVAIAPAVQVEVRDQFANKVTNASNQVTLSFIQTGRGPLTGNTATPSAGTATFASLTATQTTTGLTPDSLLASAIGLTPDTSTGFAVTPGIASKLVFLQNPTSTTGGATISPPVQVEIEDANGNRVTSSTANVTLAITSGTGTAGAHLSGGASVTVAASVGVATFNTLSVDSAGTNYTLSATSGSLTGATSNPFSISPGAASKLAFGIQPSSQNSATAISPAVTVRILDAGGNLTTSGASVTVAITNGTGTPGAHLGGTLSVGATSGTATFGTLTIDSAGPGYTLSATSGSLTGATSFAFAINVGPATKLGFRVQPNSPTGGVAFSPNVQVEVRDAGGNRVTSATTSIQLTLNGGDATAALSGSNPVSAILGVATFSGLSVDSAATSYTLVATGGGFTPATSTPFNITVGPAAKLGFHVQPTTTVAGVSIFPQVQVELQDAGGNRVATNGTTIVVAIANNAGGGTLSGNTSRNTSAGLATYNNLSINKTGTGYTLQATSGSLAATTSTPFDITPGSATTLQFTTTIRDTTAGSTLNGSTGGVVVTAFDNFGNIATGYTGLVTIDFGTNAGAGILSGTLNVNAQAGVITFNDLSINNLGVGYTLSVTASGLTGATSNAFNIL
jgi:hypothetical protein